MPTCWFTTLPGHAALKATRPTGHRSPAHEAAAHVQGFGRTCATLAASKPSRSLPCSLALWIAYLLASGLAGRFLPAGCLRHLPPCSHACLPACLLASWLTGSPPRFRACWHASTTAHLHAFLLACVPCLLASYLAGLLPGRLAFWLVCWPCLDALLAC